MPPRKEEALTKEVFEVHLEYIGKNLNGIMTEIVKLNERVAKHDETLLRNTITVEEHQKRSTMLEDNQTQIVTTLRAIADSVNQVKAQADKIEEELAPIKEHTTQVNKFMRLLIIIDDNKGLIGKIIMFGTVIAISVWMGLGKEAVIKSIVKAIF